MNTVYFSSGGSVAAKIMSRMGYKEGQGLGKKEQGMSTALQVEKVGKRSGKIIHERDIPKCEWRFIVGPLLLFLENILRLYFLCLILLVLVT